MGGGKAGGNAPPDSEMRNLAIPLPELRKPVKNAIQEANQQFTRGMEGKADAWQFGPGVVEPWNDAQNNANSWGISQAYNTNALLNPSAGLVSQVGGGGFLNMNPGANALNDLVQRTQGTEGQGPGQQLLNRFGGGEFMGNTPGQNTLNTFGAGGFIGQGPGQGMLNQVGGGAYLGNNPGQSTLNRIGEGQFATPSQSEYGELLKRAMGGSGGLGLIQGTAGGQYLQDNPHLEALINSQSRDIKRDYGDAVAGIEGRVSGAGRLGSNAEMDLQGRAQQNLGQTLGDLQTSTRYRDYNTERDRQQQSQLALPGAFSTELGAGIGAANANAGNEWQRLNTMLQGATSAGQGFRDSLGQTLQGAGMAGDAIRADRGQAIGAATAGGQLYQNSAAQALQGAGMAGDSYRADRAQQLAAAQAASGAYQGNLGQALQAAGMAPAQAAAQFMGPDALMRYGGAAQQQAQAGNQEAQDRFRYEQEAQWQNLQRYLSSLQGAGGLTNPNAGGLGVQQPQGPGTAELGIGLLGSLANAGAIWGACDRRLKTDIERLGDLSTGAGLYSYRYVWDEPGTMRLGPMAQELLEFQPDAVASINGVLMVDMAKWKP